MNASEQLSGMMPHCTTENGVVALTVAESINEMTHLMSQASQCNLLVVSVPTVLVLAVLRLVPFPRLGFCRVLLRHNSLVRAGFPWG